MQTRLSTICNTLAAITDWREKFVTLIRYLIEEERAAFDLVRTLRRLELEESIGYEPSQHYPAAVESQQALAHLKNEWLEEVYKSFEIHWEGALTAACLMNIEEKTIAGFCGYLEREFRQALALATDAWRFFDEQAQLDEQAQREHRHRYSY